MEPVWRGSRSSGVCEMRDERIVIYGATGVTGRLIAQELSARGVALRVAGRAREGLEVLSGALAGGNGEVEYVVATVDDPASLDAMLEGASLLINCVGPFVDLGKPVVEAALRWGVHYLDISAEQSHIRWVAERFDEAARARDLIFLPSCAFEFALGDLAAEIAWRAAASRIVIAYVIRDFTLSAGTKRSIVRAFSERGLTFVKGRYREEPVGYRLFTVPLPGGGERKGMWMPGGEAITVPRRGGVSRVETCLVIGEGASYLAAALSSVLPPVLRRMQPLADRVMERSQPLEIEETECDFQVVAFDPKTERAHITLQGRGIYETTARIAAEAAVRILSTTGLQRGFVGMADLFEPRQFLESVQVEIIEEEGS